MKAVQRGAMTSAVSVQTGAMGGAVEFGPEFPQCSPVQWQCNTSASKSEGLIKTPDCTRATDTLLPALNRANGDLSNWQRAAIVEALASALVEDFLSERGESPSRSTTPAPCGELQT